MVAHRILRKHSNPCFCKQMLWLTACGALQPQRCFSDIQIKKLMLKFLERILINYSQLIDYSERNWLLLLDLQHLILFILICCAALFIFYLFYLKLFTVTLTSPSCHSCTFYTLISFGGRSNASLTFL